MPWRRDSGWLTAGSAHERVSLYRVHLTRGSARRSGVLGVVRPHPHAVVGPVGAEPTGKAATGALNRVVVQAPGADSLSLDGAHADRAGNG